MSEANDTNVANSQIEWIDKAIDMLADNGIEGIELLLETHKGTESGYPEFVPFVLYLKSRVVFSKFGHADSILLLQKAERLFRIAGNEVWHAKTLLRKALDLATAGQWKESIDAFEQSRRALKHDVHIREYLPIVELNYAMAMYHFKYDTSAVLELLERSFRLNVDSHNLEAALGIVVNILRICNQIGDFKRGLISVVLADDILRLSDHSANTYMLPALRLTRKGLESRQCNASYTVAGLYVNHGNLLKSLGEAEQALDKYNRAHEIAAKNGFKDIEASVANQIAGMVAERGDLEHAIKTYEHVMEIFREDSSEGESLAIVYCNVGESYFKLRDYALAEYYFSLSLKLLRKLGLTAVEFAVNLRVGELYSEETQHHSKAQDYAATALAQAQAIGVDSLIGKCYRLLGTLHINSDLATAKELLNRALLLADDGMDATEVCLVHKTLSDLYRSLGDPAEALVHADRASEMRDQLNTTKFREILARSTAIRDAERYRSEYIKQKRKAERLQSELAKLNLHLSTMILRDTERNDFLQRIENGLVAIRATQSRESDPAVTRLIEEVRGQRKKAADRQFLELLFAEVNNVYHRYIREVAPNMSPAEMKVCVLLMQCMNTKQIANVLGITPRAVENHRTKIRRKLRIDPSVALNTHLMQMSRR